MALGIALDFLSGRKEGKDSTAWNSIPSSAMRGVEAIFALQLEFLGPTLGYLQYRVDGCGWELHLFATAKHPCLGLQPDLHSTWPVGSSRPSPFNLV